MKDTHKKLLQKVVDQQSKLSIQGYTYFVWNYMISHSRLAIRARNYNTEDDIIIVFFNVRYMQVFLDWKGDFKLATDEERLEIGKLANWGNSIEDIDEILLKNVSFLYKADTPKGKVYIAGKIAEILPYDAWNDSFKKFLNEIKE